MYAVKYILKYNNAMNNYKFKKIVVFIFFLFLACLIFVSGCERYEFFVPEYRNFTKPPDEIVVEQLLADYVTDEVAADAKYKGKRLLFTNIKVEALNVNIVDSASDPDISIINYYIEFRLRFNEDTPLIKEGFILDIIGDVRGLIGMGNRYVVVDNCWINIVEGDMEGDIPDWGY